MAWIYLLLAGVLEIAWAFGMKQSQGFTRLWPTLFTLVTMLASFGFLAAALRALPLGTAYAMWTGIGALGVFVLGIFLLGEQATTLRFAAACMIAGGIVLMKLSAS
jgi:quaternary ammonium compound-resistance protein SugE